ncbi:MogA/MoaB family molybdenum cofactor biosynthesis protein [Paenibacillus hamazuiensis]|uniref:MogA/MoaB family molybdenum cofactor biosynthesis protein n=1 Tax=Paenibacillus hamazuiensis TaxID=2936508 RepID=UPI00200F8A32|nr:MogA/MoaB family molybdenum cofactor biosynthesis protein [Paenibacillus hamazuiensis]
MIASSIEQHRKEAPPTVRCLIVTVSDTRTLETDKSGQLMRELLEAEGYVIVGRHIVKDDYAGIQQLLRQAGDDPQVEAVLLNGGTGIAKRDTTYEAVRDVLDKELQGFGEIFRFLSYTEDIGPAAILSRAVAGVYRDKAIFSMPGSSGAVKLALTKIIIPELKHVMREIYKDVT